MEYNEKVKFLDLVFKNIKNIERFDIVEILKSETKKNEKECKHMQSFLKPFGIKTDLFEIVTSTKESTHLKLTKKGEDLKNFKKGFIKFEEKDKPKKYSIYKIASFILTFVLACSTIYFAQANYRLKLQESKVPSLVLKVDSLKNELNRLNKKQFESKVKPILDTLETKKESL